MSREIQPVVNETDLPPGISMRAHVGLALCTSGPRALECITKAIDLAAGIPNEEQKGKFMVIVEGIKARLEEVIAGGFGAGQTLTAPTPQLGNTDNE